MTSKNGGQFIPALFMIESYHGIGDLSTGLFSLFCSIILRSDSNLYQRWEIRENKKIRKILELGVGIIGKLQ